MVFTTVFNRLIR